VTTRAILAAFLVTLCHSLAAADTLADVRSRGELVWGADQEGGGPYVFPRDDDPEQVTGFEVELADRLAAFLGVKARFFQGQWDKMPELLHTKKVDVVLNGYEWTRERLAAMDATIPYFVYGLQLLARKDDSTLADAADLAKPSTGRKRKIGVLTGSAAETYAREHFAPGAEIVSYDGNTDTLREVETGKLDATIEDTPIAIFYGPRFPAVRPIGAPFGHGYYVVYVRKGEAALVAALDQALIAIVRSGELERLYRRWGLWSDAQQELARIAETGRFYGFDAAVGAKVDPAMPATFAALRFERPHGWDVVRRYGIVLLESAGMTVILSVLSFPLAITAGLLIALGRLYGPPWLRPILTGYVEFLRGTPLMLQLYFIFFFLPEIGINVPAFWTAILGLAINYSAYESEIYRAGLQAIPPGQMEAALSLGMSRALALRRIVVPQAVRIVIPPVVNDFIALFKDTSVCSVVTLVELTKRFSVLSQSTQATVELMVLTAILYMAMSTPLTLLSRRLERRLGVTFA